MLDANKLTELTDFGFETITKLHLNLCTLGPTFSHKFMSSQLNCRNSISERQIFFSIKYKMAKFYQFCIISKTKGFCCMLELALFVTNWCNISGAQ